MALWSRAGRLPGADEELTLVLPAGTTVRRRKVTVPRHALLEELLALPADIEVGPSLRAWSVAARLALELVARGRLSPTVNPSGHDVWRLGPFDPDDARRQAALAVVLPPEAHCHPLPGSGPLRLPSPTAIVRAFGDAVADIVPRTAAAAGGGHQAFAAEEPHPVGDAIDWFSAAAPGPGRTSVVLRLVPPADVDVELGPQGESESAPAPVAANVAAPLSSSGPEPEFYPGSEQDFSAELVLQSPDDPSLLVPVAKLWDAPDTVMSYFADAEDTLLLTLRRAARVWPALDRSSNRPGPIGSPLATTNATTCSAPWSTTWPPPGSGSSGPPSCWPRSRSRHPTPGPRVQTAHRAQTDLQPLGPPSRPERSPAVGWPWCGS